MTDILPENINFQFLAEQQARILTELDRLRTEQHHIRTGQHDMRNEQHHAPGTGASARRTKRACRDGIVLGPWQIAGEGERCASKGLKRVRFFSMAQATLSSRSATVTTKRRSSSKVVYNLPCFCNSVPNVLAKRLE